jgi:murein DD-endopeptidase MepM/ murein hydrolase activator NlpD
MKIALSIIFLMYSINGLCQSDSLSTKLATTHDSLEKLIDRIEARDDSLFTLIQNGGIIKKDMSSSKFDYDKLSSDYKAFKSKYHKLIASDKLPNILPVSNIQSESIIGFGDKLHPVFKTYKLHEGIDIPVVKGASIISTIDGKVVIAGNSFGRLGNQVIIQNNDSVKIIFYHLGEIVVKEGDIIKCGQVIGYAGNTGLSITNHVHYEIQINDIKVDPIFSVFNKTSYRELRHIYKTNIQSLD